MAWNRLFFTDIDEGAGQLGGGAWLEDISLWPLNPDTGGAMLPLLMINSTFLAIPFLPAGMVLTVFISAGNGATPFGRSQVRKYTVHQQSELDTVRNGYTTVLLHKKSDAELYPEGMPTPITKKYVALREFTEQDMDEELEDELGGAGFSKQLGRPCWLQDPVRSSQRFYFLAQLLESDVVKLSPAHEGVFSGGIGYLFADNQAKKQTVEGASGYFFIQFT